MDLSSPAVLRATVTHLIHKIAQGGDDGIEQSAIDALVRPAREWGYDRLTDVDLVCLEKALRAVMLQVPQTYPPSPIDGRKIAYALPRSKCHYLWFC